MAFVSIIRSELGIITTTAVLRRCVKAVTSPQLLQGIDGNITKNVLLLSID